MYVVETIEDPVLPQNSSPIGAVPVPVTPPKSRIPKKGELSSSLKKKMFPPVVEQAPTVSELPTSTPTVLPAFLQTRETPALENSSPNEAQVSKPVKTVSLATVMRSYLPGSQVVSMSIPALVTVALMLTITSFFAGRFSSLSSKQVSAQESPPPTALPALNLPAAPSQMGTPDDIIKSAQDEFNKALTLSKQTDETASEKETVSKSILNVLDTLTKGIAAYPDVASLYFERGEVEKMVMVSAPTLKAQAESDYQKALSLSPLTANYYSGFADYYDLAGVEDLAIANYEKAVKLEPKDINSMYPLAKLYAANNRKPEAQALFTQILSLLTSGSAQYTQVNQDLQNLIDSTSLASSSAALATSSAVMNASPSASAH